MPDTIYHKLRKLFTQQVVLLALLRMLVLIGIFALIVWLFFLIIPKSGYISFDGTSFDRIWCRSNVVGRSSRDGTDSYKYTNLNIHSFKGLGVIAFSDIFGLPDLSELTIRCDYIIYDRKYYSVNDFCTLLVPKNEEQKFPFSIQTENNEPASLTFSSCGENVFAQDAAVKITDLLADIRLSNPIMKIYSKEKLQVNFMTVGMYKIIIDGRDTIDCQLDVESADKQLYIGAEPVHEIQNNIFSMSKDIASIIMTTKSTLFCQFFMTNEFEISFYYPQSLFISSTSGTLQYSGKSPKIIEYQPRRQDFQFTAKTHANYDPISDAFLTLKHIPNEEKTFQFNGVASKATLSGNDLNPSFGSWLYDNGSAIMISVFASILFSIISVMFSINKRKEEQLEKLFELKQKGIITEEEFNQQKSKLL